MTVTRCTVVAVLVSASVAAGCDVNSALERLIEARRLSADLRVGFAKAADASNKAVMAETDETARTFAEQAAVARGQVQQGLDTLGPLLQELRFADEARVLGQFSRDFQTYRDIDERILDLAVENTNAKARRLAFGPAFEAADAFSSSLNRLAPSSSGSTWQVRALVAGAVAAVREIQALQAPHIAEAADGRMTVIEARVRLADVEARTGLRSLEPLVDRPSRQRVAEARASLERFMALTTEITALSRRNTDVRALALSLTEKEQITTACENSLRVLRDALAKRGFGGTR